MEDLELVIGARSLRFSGARLLAAAGPADLATAVEPGRLAGLLWEDLAGARAGRLAPLEAAEADLLERLLEPGLPYRDRVAAAVLHAAVREAAAERRSLAWAGRAEHAELRAAIAAIHERFEAPFCAYDGTHALECVRRHRGLAPAASLLACYLAEAELVAGCPAGRMPLDGSSEMAAVAGAAIASLLAAGAAA